MHCQHRPRSYLPRGPGSTSGTQEACEANAEGLARFPGHLDKKWRKSDLSGVQSPVPNVMVGHERWHSYWRIIQVSDEPTRADLAEDRTILANERIFGSWMPTSLGCVAIGVGFKGLFALLEPDSVPRAIATGFLFLAVLVIVLAERRAAAVRQQPSWEATLEVTFHDDLTKIQS